MRPGEVLADRFKIVGFIARGGMGDVYEAEDLVVGTVVALKLMRPEVVADRESRDRFRREIQLARQVSHRNVCRIFDVIHVRHTGLDGRPREVLGYSMELLHGESLKDRIRRLGPLAPDDALPIAAQIAAALTAAHVAGVIHRDLKSANVMLVPEPGSDEAGRAVVTDFGLASHLILKEKDIKLTGEDQAVGTADYMAPEQAEGKPLDVTCDIYALGVVLFEMVTGLKPHNGETPVAVLLSKIRDPAPSPCDFAPGLDRRWEQVILRCLEYEPENRFHTAGEVLAALDVSGSATAVAPELIASRPDWKLSRSKPSYGRLLVVAASAVALVSLVSALAALWWAGADRPQDVVAHVPESLQLTTWEALEVDPAFSPDGGTIAFSSNRDGWFEIFIRQLAAGSREIKITGDGEQNFQPEWSPDGEWIAYASHGRQGIWLVPSLGGTPRRVTDFGSHPAWSSDGGLIVFQSDETAELSANATAAMPPSTLWVVKPDGSDLRRLTVPGRPAGGHGAPQWTPGDHRVVFSVSNRTWSQLWTIDVDGGVPESLITELQAAFDPLPAPNSDRVYYATISRGEHYGVWSMPVSWATGKRTGSPVRVVDMGRAAVRQFDISADGRRLVHTALATSSNLWTVAVSEDGLPLAEPAQLTNGSGRNSRPAYSPDGELLAFDRWHVGKDQDVWVMPAEGGEPSIVSRDEDVDTQASWSPDGRSVLFFSERGGTNSLWSASLDGGDEKLVTRLGHEVDSVRVSPDGARIVFHWTTENRPTNVWTARSDGGEPRQLTFDEEMAGYPCWSPDGETVAFEYRRGDDDFIGVVPSAGGEVIELVTVAGKSWPYSWSPDGDKIAFAGLRDGRWNLYWVSVSSGMQRQITQWDQPNTYVRYPAWSPDGDRIAFEKAETTGDLWLIEGVR